MLTRLFHRDRQASRHGSVAGLLNHARLVALLGVIGGIAIVSGCASNQPTGTQPSSLGGVPDHSVSEQNGGRFSLSQP